MKICIVFAAFFLLGMGFSLFYERLTKAWRGVYGAVTFMGITWISRYDPFGTAMSREALSVVCIIALLAGTLIGEGIVRLRRYLKNKKNPSENTSKGELS